LDEKTPLCKNCQIKVDKFNAAQEKRLPKRLDIKDRHDDEKNAPSFHLLNPSQKSAVVYAASQYLWYSVHIFALVVNAYGKIMKPPTGRGYCNLLTTIPKKGIAIHLQAPK
jgi:hypothetical protein